MARSVQQRNREAFVDRTSLGIRLVALLTFPAAAAMFVLRRPIVGMVLQHGKFDAARRARSRAARSAGSRVGLVGFSVYLFVLRGFYAHDDARTPFVINLFENVINIVLAFVLVEQVRRARARPLVRDRLPRCPRCGRCRCCRTRCAASRSARCSSSLGRMLARRGGDGGGRRGSSPRAVGGNTGLGAVARVACGRRSSGSSSTSVVLVVIVRAPELDQLRGPPSPAAAEGPDRHRIRACSSSSRSGGST